MKNYAAGWKAFENPRHFPAPYHRQKGWERAAPDNGGQEKSGFQFLPEQEAVQLGLPGGMAARGKGVAGCQPVAAPVVSPVVRGRACKRLILRIFPLLTTKATKKSEKKKSGKETVCRGLCTGFLNAVVRLRCQAPTQPADRTQHPDGNAPGYFMEVNAYGRNKAEQLSGKGAGTGTEAQGRPVHRLP